jgi:hypothetical protein
MGGGTFENAVQRSEQVTAATGQKTLLNNKVILIWINDRLYNER